VIGNNGFLAGLIALVASDVVTCPIVGRRNPADIYFGPRELRRECPILICNSGKNCRMLPGVISGNEYGGGAAGPVRR
jgi:hypothetical protein